MPDILSPPLAGPLKVTQPFHAGHRAVDLAAATGTPVLAAATGVVTYARWGAVTGLELRIDHGAGIETRYLHLSTRFASEGGKVKAGQTVALSGATGVVTGPHLHFELVISGTKVDPMIYLAPGQALTKDGTIVPPNPYDDPVEQVIHAALNVGIVVLAVVLAFGGVRKILET